MNWSLPHRPPPCFPSSRFCVILLNTHRQGETTIFKLKRPGSLRLTNKTNPQTRVCFHCWFKTVVSSQNSTLSSSCQRPLDVLSALVSQGTEKTSWEDYMTANVVREEPHSGCPLPSHTPHPVNTVAGKAEERTISHREHAASFFGANVQQDVLAGNHINGIEKEQEKGRCVEFLSDLSAFRFSGRSLCLTVCVQRRCPLIR